jgi:microcin C transport system permease protein
MGKILDYLWHMVLPIIASVVGSFAVMTMLTKNSFSRRSASSTC